MSDEESLSTKYLKLSSTIVVLDKILFQIQLTPIGDLLPFSVKQQVSVLTAWVPFIGMTVIAFMLFLGWQVYKPKKETIVT